jgi:Beta-galactosidase
MEFGTWYQINCESEDTWADDFAIIRDTGFDFVCLWNVVPAPGDREIGGDLRALTARDKVRRALDALGKVGLGGYLGIFHPYNVGNIAAEYRLRYSDGRSVNGPNLFNRQWLQRQWVPYVRRVGEAFRDHSAYRGGYFDDTFPSVPSGGTAKVSYTPADRQRFSQWLRRRYLRIDNLNMCYKIRDRKGYRRFDSVRPPTSPEQGLPLWADWMAARAEWCEEFARLTKEAYRATDPDPSHILVLSDQDYHMRCTSLQYGVDYHRLLRHFDRLEIYMAHEHERISRRELLANTEHVLDQGLRLAGGDRFQFHTWFVDPVTYRPMKPTTLAAMIECAIARNVAAIEVYTFKVREWRQEHLRGLRGARPVLKEISLKYNPQILRCLADVIARA